MRRLITRRIPGFTWIQLGLNRKWQTGHWWAVRGFCRAHHFGFFYVLTMRSDAIERGKRNGIFS